MNYIKMIKTISLTFSMFGIFILLIISVSNTPKMSKISSINELDINKNIKISGNIKEIKVYENNFTIITVKDNTGTIKVICECGNIDTLKIGQAIEIIGKVIEYNGKIEIEAEKIKVYKS